MSDPWFARRFPVDDPRNAMAPASWKGWAVAGGFIAAMIAGGLVFAVVAIAFGVIWGAIAFACIATGAAATLIALSVAKGDATRTVEDIRGPDA
ncbi:MAG: hypothetical protein NW203_14635 [Hyphomonadaceae bacterium]|nr:hypothetical protein [Hyphomonadaceae bacterium]